MSDTSPHAMDELVAEAQRLGLYDQPKRRQIVLTFDDNMKLTGMELENIEWPISNFTIQPIDLATLATDRAREELSK